MQRYHPDRVDDTASSSDTLLGSDDGDEINAVRGKLLMQVSGALARLGRGKQVGLGLDSKEEFLKAWKKYSR